MWNRISPSPLDLRRLELFDVRVRAVTANAVGVEQADAEDEVLGRLRARAS